MHGLRDCGVPRLHRRAALRMHLKRNPSVEACRQRSATSMAPAFTA